MSFRVLCNGKAIAGAPVINDLVNDPDAAPVTPGEGGMARLVVRNQDLNVIRAAFFGPSDQPKKHQRIEHTATLAFTLMHAPD